MRLKRLILGILLVCSILLGCCTNAFASDTPPSDFIDNPYQDSGYQSSFLDAEGNDINHVDIIFPYAKHHTELGGYVTATASTSSSKYGSYKSPEGYNSYVGSTAMLETSSFYVFTAVNVNMWTAMEVSGKRYPISYNADTKTFTVTDSSGKTILTESVGGSGNKSYENTAINSPLDAIQVITGDKVCDTSNGATETQYRYRGSYATSNLCGNEEEYNFYYTDYDYECSSCDQVEDGNGCDVVMYFELDGVDEECYAYLEQGSFAPVAVINGTKFYFAAFGTYALYLGEALGLVDLSGVPSAKSGSAWNAVDVYQVDGSVTHFLTADCFGKAHSLGAGTIDSTGTVLTNTYKSFNQGVQANTTGNSYTFYPAIDSSTTQDSVGYWSCAFWNTSPQDGICSMQSKLQYLQYAYTLYMGNTCHVIELQASNHFCQEVFGWTRGCAGPGGDDDVDLDKRITCVRYYDIAVKPSTYSGYTVKEWSVRAGLENLDGTSRAGGKFSGSSANNASTQATYRQILDEVGDSLINTLSEADNMRLIEDAVLTNSDELEGITTWENAIDYNTESKLVKFMRISVQIIGVVLMLYGILLYLAYWIDRLNNIIDVRFVSVLTLGKLKSYNPDDESTQSHRGIVIICLTCEVVGILLLSGIFYNLIRNLVLGIQNVL